MLRTITVGGVREAYPLGLATLAEHGIREETRNGPAIVLPGPMVTTYTRPWERVLLDPRRDANPFFHLMESLWMLAGRRDVESLMRYNAGMVKYSDDGVSFHGAYGHRWRRHFSREVQTDMEMGIGDGHRGPVAIETTMIDQLVTVVEALRASPGDRRAVIAMWDPAADLGRPGLDFPCNTHIYLRMRHVHEMAPPVGGVWTQPGPDQDWDQLDMTLMCRSNDAIWGAYGANAVHFSVLHEFLSALLGCRQGELHQLSNNFHAYVEQMERVGEPWLEGIRPEYGATTSLFGDLRQADPRDVLAEIETIWDDDPDGEVELIPATTIRLVSGMRLVWAGWKNRRWDVCEHGLREIPHPDWRRACAEWLERRRDKFS